MTIANSTFEFIVGTGVIRAKPTPHNVLVYGRLALPSYGQCYVDGKRMKDATSMVLDVRAADTRKLVAQLTVPCGGVLREGTLKTRRKSYRVVAELRSTVIGGKKSYRLALNLPEVKKQGTGWL